MPVLTKLLFDAKSRFILERFFLFILSKGVGKELNYICSHGKKTRFLRKLKLNFKSFDMFPFFVPPYIKTERNF